MGGSNSTGSAKMQGTPYKFIYGGFFRVEGWIDQGVNGRYWTATQGSNTLGYQFKIEPSALSTLSSQSDKRNGRSVRCIAAGT